MNGKERLTIAVQSIADGHTGVEKGTELLIQIFGDIYDEGRDLVVQSLNPPTIVKKPDEVYSILNKHTRLQIASFGAYDLGGES